MRNAFISTLCRLAKQDENICLLTGDLGYHVLDDFLAAFPHRFFNMGICEQNMASVAAGMALEGKRVFIYSIGNFPTLRCLEQIRNDIAYHNVPVVIVAVGGGLTYGPMGMSHHATEDIGIMRCIPNMAVLTPSDPYEAEVLTEYAVKRKGPCYLRLGKAGERQLKEKKDEIRIGKAREIIKGGEKEKKTAIFAAGPVAEEAVKAAEKLEKMQISCNVYSLPCIKPVDGEDIYTIAKDMDLICTLEEHNVMGGAGGVIAEVLSGHGCKTPLVRFGLQDVFSGIVGDQVYLRKQYGMDLESIVRKIILTLRTIN